MGNAIGPDVSFYQDQPETPQHIDFVKMGKTADFVIIRAGQNLWVDRDFKYNWAEAKKAGLPRGTYWFYDSRADPKRQAELWVESMGGDFGELPLFADFEDAYGGQYQGWRKWYDFLERLIGIAIPRMRDFRGLNPKSFDGRGNFAMGIQEQIVFAEIDYDKIDKIRGMDIAITTSARTNEEGLALLRAFNFPFRN